MKIYNINSVNYHFYSSIKLILEDNHFVNVIYDNSDNFLSISSSWGYCACFYKEATIEKFFTKNSIESILDQLNITTNEEKVLKLKEQEHYLRLKKDLIPKLKTFLQEGSETQVQINDTTIVSKNKKLLNFISSFFNVQMSFTTDSMPFFHIADLYTGNPSIDEKTNKYIHETICEILKINMPLDLINQSTGKVLHYIAQEIKKKPKDQRTFCGEIKPFLRIKGIQQDENFYRISFPYLIYNQYLYQKAYIKHHPDCDREHPLDISNDKDKIYGDFPLEIVFEDDKVLKCKNIEDYISTMNYYLQFYQDDRDVKDKIFRDLN